MTPMTAEGAEYLRLATTLLRRMRLASPEGGVWEAADIQWWSRRDQRTGLFWLDEDGEPLAAFLATHFGSVQCDVLVLPGDKDFARQVWQAGIDQAGISQAGVGLAGVGRAGAAEFTVRLDDATGVAALEAAGYRLADPAGVVACWMDAADRPPVPRLESGYRLVSRAGEPDRPHPMIARNGEYVQERLRQCSLYRPDLALAIVAPGGEVAGYGLFWPDPVTGVGLVEPIRTEQGHEGRGLAGHLVATGLDLLAASGCRRLKVSNDRGLYTRLGFRRLDSATAGIYTREENP
jgi:Acetyltransferase (GNAT) family